MLFNADADTLTFSWLIYLSDVTKPKQLSWCAGSYTSQQRQLAKTPTVFHLISEHFCVSQPICKLSYYNSVTSEFTQKKDECLLKEFLPTKRG